MNVSHYVLLLKRLLLLQLLYTLCRLIFLLVNWAQFAGASVSALLATFADGLLFDLTSILLINLPFIVLSILPFKWVNRLNFQSKLALFFQFLNIPFLILNVINAGYFKYSGKAIVLSAEAGVGSLSAEQIWVLISGYWYVSVLALLVVCLLVWFDPSYYYLTSKRTIARMWGFLGIFLALAISLLLFALVLRSHEPDPSQELASEKAYLQNLSHNATFNFLSGFYRQATNKLDER